MKTGIRAKILIAVLTAGVFIIAQAAISTAADQQQGQPLPWLSAILLKYSITKHIKDVDTEDQILASEVVVDQHGREIVITQLMIVFKNEARMPEINQLLEELNATIIRSVAGTRYVIVRIPQPANLNEYYSLIDQIEAKPFVESVLDGVLPREDELPPSYNPNPTQYDKLNYLDNHLAIRAHAAWNVKNAIKSSPYFAIADSFGQGAPNGPPDLFNYNLVTGHFGSGAPYTAETHGYMVLGVVLASHTSHLPTGMFPKTLSIGVFDTSRRWLSWNVIIAELHALLRDMPPRNIVLNTSFGYLCRDGYDRKCLSDRTLRAGANVWISGLRDLGLHYRVLHVTAAGNILKHPPTPPNLDDIDDASTISPFASAALFDGLTYNGAATPNSRNTLVVENIVGTSPYTLESDPVKGECLNSSSWVGGNISGIGSDIISFTDPVGTLSDNRNGTSYASPQVAALAAYLWAIHPGHIPQTLIDLIKDTADPVSSEALLPECKAYASPAPIVDAYEAVLALDAAAAPTMSNSPVRFALMDVDNDRQFDGDDLGVFYDAYFNGDGSPIIPDERDWGRYDLNGDGWTTATPTVPGSGVLVDDIKTAIPFDMDRTGSTLGSYKPNLTTEITQTINNETVTYNEQEVTDKDILCYYAYSGLYTGNTAVRDNLLLSICGSNYTKLDANGDPLPDSATSWTCVKDERTFLVWEKKTDDGGLRDKNLSYYWYDPNPATNGGAAGHTDPPNTYNYVLAVNSLGLCGASDWRMPSVYELEGLLEFPGTMWINTDYFPNSGGRYWSSSTAFWRIGYSAACFDLSSHAWYTNFFGGSSGCNSKYYSVKLTRLVRGP